ncbi:hypothetical protein [Micromonospora endolithica]|uniref:hypothetical protein n=1 Tax=Micromonospora endolithica TaxID=230091 RepID=UPI0013154ED1|nr:hypothetical protein [Micromonospora endolithica]
MFLVAVGAVGAGWFLLGEGLDRAEKWVSIVGVCVSTALSGGGLLLGWLTWRQTRAVSHATRAVTALGVGAVGIGGSSGGQIQTDVSGVAKLTSPAPGGGAGVHAGGLGSVAVGGDSTAPISTRVTGPDAQRRP